MTEVDELFNELVVNEVVLSEFDFDVGGWKTETVVDEAQAEFDFGLQTIVLKGDWVAQAEPVVSCGLV